MPEPSLVAGLGPGVGSGVVVLEVAVVAVVGGGEGDCSVGLRVCSAAVGEGGCAVGFAEGRSVVCEAGDGSTLGDGVGFAGRSVAFTVGFRVGDGVGGRDVIGLIVGLPGVG